MVGMTMALQFTVFLGAVFVYGVAKGPPTAEREADVLKYGNVKGTILPPSVIEEMSKDPDHLNCLKQLTYIQWAGAPLSKSTGNLLVNDVELMPCIGSTEAGAWFPKTRKDHDWNYYTFRESMGIELKKRTENEYEVVFVRKPEYAQWQQIFRVYPDLTEFCTKDLFAKHPTKENLWEYVGRLDDMINFADGQSLRVAALEDIIQSHPNVRSALIGGEKRPWPFLVIEPMEGDSSKLDDKLIDDVWPTVERANELCLDGCHMQKGFTLLTKPSKPMPRTAKGTVARREAAALYEEDVEAMYKSAQ
ncbi:MAG: hypothetical protein L6R37_006338 [Teloschistes peruensis]|nr:MAG: hypothetical protein L6R37_006338 [Teloschistes peruensis]